MNLFNTSNNLLPYDGEVNYHGAVFPYDDSKRYFEKLQQEIEWEHDEAYMFGKHIITKRKVAWYANENFLYTYSNVTKTALAWTDSLLELKEKVEQLTMASYNSCLLNLYHDGSEGMAWHSDDEKALGTPTTIASLTFGATRKFAFKHKRTKETIFVVLESGSLLVMKGTTQNHWLHRLPPTKKVKHPRINLTFRQMRY
ncbi:MAG: alpha-ketoglutarate-dependent dioxygenase AlkB [Saprospiraceae bacterium]|nr:alpha-ketoglutarate-dependent dioxygenase AlkB [Saprospiraceae bacterium]